MQKYRDTIADRNGNALPGVSVLIKNYPAGTTATIYSDNGVTPAANPLTTDGYGAFQFYAADGHYSIVVSGSSITTTTVDDVLLEDPDTATRRFVDAGESVTINVPADYATIQAALSAISAWVIANTGTVTIQVADGTLTLSSSINLNHPYGSRIRLIGNQTTPDNCIIRGPNPPTFDAVICSDGNKFGFIDGFMIDIAAKAGAANPYTALLALGHASIVCGTKIKTNNWYYGIAARDHSYIRADGANVNNAGDVGIWAFNGSMIDASSAVSNNASDSPNLGFGIQAEYGSSINCDSASTSGCLIAGIASLSNSIVRAPSSAASSNTGSGYFARDGGVIEAHSGTASSNTRFGMEFFDGSAVITGNSMTLTGNTKGPIGPSRTAGSRNILINPEFTVSQFGTTFSNPASGDYTIDRWRVRKANGAGTAPTINVKQNSAAAFGDGVINCLELEISAVGSFGAGAFWLIEQPIANPTQFRNRTVTGQFLIWASAPITLSARAEISDSASQSNSSTVTSLTTTPQLVTVTRTIDAAATSMAFDLSLFLGNISGTASVYVASTQLKAASYPSPVEVTADAQAELMRCLPYAERLLVDTNEAIGMADAHTTTSCRTVLHHFPKRRLPLSTEVTVSNAANFALQANNTSIAMSSVGGINPGRRATTINFTTSGLTQGTAGYLRASADSQYVDIKAEV